MMLAYRTNYYSGILIYTINIGAYYFLWQAIYSGKENIESLSISQMTTYIAIAWMARAFYFNNIDREIAMEIQEGRVAVELIRPYNYLGMKVMQGLGEGIFRFAFFFHPGHGDRYAIIFIANYNEFSNVVIFLLIFNI